MSISKKPSTSMSNGMLTLEILVVTRSLILDRGNASIVVLDLKPRRTSVAISIAFMQLRSYSSVLFRDASFRDLLQGLTEFRERIIGEDI
jgi:hypothetical protein